MYVPIVCARVWMCMIMCIHIHTHIHIMNVYAGNTLIERNPPPRGGFVFTMFPDQEPCVRGPPSKDLYQVLRGGSSYARLLIREHGKPKTPPGGGGSFDQRECAYWQHTSIHINIHVCIHINIHVSIHINIHTLWIDIHTLWINIHIINVYTGSTSQKVIWWLTIHDNTLWWLRMRRVTLLTRLERVFMCICARVLTYVPTVCGRVSICILMSMLMRILICMLMCVVICMLMRIPTGLCRYQRKCIFFWTS